MEVEDSRRVGGVKMRRCGFGEKEVRGVRKFDF